MISISVVLFNNSKLEVETFINEAFKNKKIKQIIFIDNSKTRSFEYDSFANKKLVFIKTRSNLGYGKGHNLALKKILFNEDIKYHLIANLDIVFDYKIFDRLANFMDSNPEFGLISPHICNTDGSSQKLTKLLPTIFDFARRLFRLDVFFRSADSRYVLERFAEKDVIFTPFISGCFMFLRKEYLTDVGTFDEKFFMYGEDIDFSRRFSERGINAYITDIEVKHTYGKAYTKSIKMLFIQTYNILRYFCKWGIFVDKNRKKINKKYMTMNEKESVE